MKNNCWLIPFCVLLYGCPASFPVVDSNTKDFGPIDTFFEKQFLEASPDYFVPDFNPTAHDRCGGGQELVFSAGSVSVSGSTAMATNQYGGAIRCGGPIQFEGPQQYYELSLAAGNTYRFTLESEFSSFIYLSSVCGINAINIDCSSIGATGHSAGPIAAGSSGGFLFSPSISGTYHLAVDSEWESEKGSYDLSVEEFTEPSNGVCAGAVAKLFSGEKLTIQGTTLGAKNEFDEKIGCGLGVDFDGPQVYYTVELSEGNWYEISLLADFAAGVYVGNTLGECKPENLDGDCGSLLGTVMLVKPGVKQSTAFSPSASGIYLLVVDSLQLEIAGEFTLEIESYTPKGNMICSAAQKLSFAGGKASVTSTTATFLNERGASLHCGASPRMLAPQVYYQLDLEAEKYLFSLTPKFDAFLALGGSCISLAGDCGSGGIAGAYFAVPTNTEGSFTFQPDKAGPFIIAVDGNEADDFGSFKLNVSKVVAPTNGVCEKPQLLALGTDGKASIVGDTGPLKNDLLGVNCGIPNGPWLGPQAYFSLSLKGGSTAKLEVIPETSFDPALYAFEASTGCDPSAINTGCSVHASDKKGDGLKEEIIVVPNSDADFVVVVDSWSPSEVGTFTLNVTVTN
ncbi:MAG: hypothetical protein V1754_00555 [Pseudomonadota bacterium]